MSKPVLPGDLNHAAPVHSASFDWAAADKRTELFADYGVSHPAIQLQEQEQKQENILQELAKIAQVLDLMSLPEKASNLERLIDLVGNDRKD